MVAKGSLALLLMTVVAVGCGSTTTTEEDSDADAEDVPGETSDALRSVVDCHETTETAYRHGSSFDIRVIKVGGKTVAKPAGHAFLKMQKAADAAGVRLSLSSGFRTMDEQRYFYHCYTSGSCNHGNLAARPGYSNHQSGSALDVSTSSWLAKNASRFGFVRTVSRESWHYEFTSQQDPGGPCTETTALPASDDAPAADDAPAP
jgi:hypothetical protein